MLRKKFKSIFILIFAIIITENSFSIEPNIFVQSTVNRASQILSEDTSKNEKIDKLKVIAKETVDIRGIGFYTLGKYRKTLNDIQKDKYSELFYEYFLKSFSSRLSEYSNPKIDVQSQEKLNENYTIVSSILVVPSGRKRLNSTRSKNSLSMLVSATMGIAIFSTSPMVNEILLSPSGG